MKTFDFSIKAILQVKDCGDRLELPQLLVRSGMFTRFIMQLLIADNIQAQNTINIQNIDGGQMHWPGNKTNK